MTQNKLAEVIRRAFRLRKANANQHAYWHSTLMQMPEDTLKWVMDHRDCIRNRNMRNAVEDEWNNRIEPALPL